MSIELSAVSGSLLKTVVQQVTKAVVANIGSALNPASLERALKASIVTANNWDTSQPANKQLFARVEPKVARELLERFFKNKNVQKELQKPLKNEGLPEFNYLLKAFEQVAAELNIQLKEADIEAWIRKFDITYLENINTYLKFQATKEEYFVKLAKWFDDVKFAGIAVAGQEVEKSEKLAQIFVMPDVVEEVQHSQRSSGFDPDVVWKDKAGNIISEKDKLNNRQQRQWLELDKRFGRKFSAQQLISQSQSQKVVLLGAPGSGKTTLMSYFAVMLAQKQPEQLGLAADIDWLPILIRIRDLARQSDINILNYTQQFAEKSLSLNVLPAGFFEYWLEDGRALILLDGLDEVAEETKRYEVVSRIGHFLRKYNQNRAIVTSRPAGYKRDFFRTEEFPHYHLQSFDDLKIEEFINRWYDSRVPDSSEAQRRKDSLRKALSANDRIKLLARNPLLLASIALIHRYQAQLPRERYKLYDRAVETLLTAWDASKELSNHSVLKYLDLYDLRRLLESLAYWIHTQGNTEDKEGGTLIKKDELIEHLCRNIVAQRQIEPLEARKEAERLVDLIQNRTGLLNEQGQDFYAFVHKTFQEYLCAQEINYQADNEGDFEIVLNHIEHYLHDHHWREVLLLLIAQQTPKKAARAIRAILNHHSDYEPWLHRDLLFALLLPCRESQEPESGR